MIPFKKISLLCLLPILLFFVVSCSDYESPINGTWVAYGEEYYFGNDGKYVFNYSSGNIKGEYQIHEPSGHLMMSFIKDDVKRWNETEYIIEYDNGRQTMLMKHSILGKTIILKKRT